MALKVYDPANVVVTVNGILITGFPSGTFISFDQNADSFSLTVGCDGESCRAKSNNRSGRLTLTLLQSSNGNQVLSALHALDLVTPNGDAIFAVFIKDTLSTDTLLMEKSWIVRDPTKEFSNEVSNRAWIIETNSFVMNSAGSPSL